MNSRHRFYTHAAAFSISIFFASVCSLAHAETVRIGGTGAAMGTMQIIGEAFEKAYPEHDVKVMPSLGTSGGLKALQASALDIAISARDVNEKEKASGLSSYMYGTTAFILVSNKKASPQPLTKNIIADLYSGKQASWSNGQPVRLVLRPKSDSDTLQLTKFSPEIEQAVMAAHAKSGMTLAVTDTDSADQVEQTSGAFATSTLALVLAERRDFNILPLDGVKPTIQTLTNGSYPHTKNMYAVTGANPSPAVKQFMEFLRSSQGQEILKKIGYKPSAAL